MTRYLISFDDGAMIFPEAELPEVDKAAHDVVQEVIEGSLTSVPIRAVAQKSGSG